MLANTVLVTGATGRIGRIVAADLLERGYRVRATTSRPQAIGAGEGVDWRKVDFLGNPDYDDLVAGCDAIIHLAAELGKKDRMKQVNVEATRALAAAAERANVPVFCYASSVSVYGSGRSINVDEESEVLTPDRDVRSEYWALDYVREYGRTKLAGELALRDVAKKVRYVILRPAVVVDISQMVSVRDWNPVKRMLAAHRHAHHIYVGDVSDAFIWFMRRGIAGQSRPGSVSVYNLAEDDYPTPRHVDFMRKAFAVTGDHRFRTLAFPWIADWMHDFLRFRTLPLRSPLWRMRFSNERLKAEGYRFRYGMAKAEELALGRLRLETHHRPSQGLGEEPA
ncbi:Nucleoside-diphosphate-sugar epimerase [Rhizobium tibeticum]|uniref:Cholesterol dehydrogenase n=1 Tax=Rhizobium tibeticum TaxID=501024 RepID=A0A1H8NSD4_9HYPH|nr:NAD(P)-dependent oxidoreductase [Rhizobium tibeticum]SEI00585.1 Cholesterol dehydrogenase [Rhizobium tibeticum]SEO32505.1 Nucleoside-diphosphate-sugar epimerase [Rhizobium tibeticum]